MPELTPSDKSPEEVVNFAENLQDMHETYQSSINQAERAAAWQRAITSEEQAQEKEKLSSPAEYVLAFIRRDTYEEFQETIYHLDNQYEVPQYMASLEPQTFSFKDEEGNWTLDPDELFEALRQMMMGAGNNHSLPMLYRSAIRSAAYCLDT